jgi:hypothetical protein
MANQEQSHKITKGPSREELFDALRLRHEGRALQMTVGQDVIVRTADGPRRSLTTTLPLILKVRVDSIGVEDGSGSRWMLSLFDKDIKLGSEHLVAYYDTTLRAGSIVSATR